jgi:DNA-binding NarL/FixJ family response regulator
MNVASTTTRPTRSKRALVVDDHPVFRLGLAQALRSLDDVAEVVEAPGAALGLALWRAGTFDLVTIDLSLPDGEGFGLLREARNAGLPGVAVVVSVHDERGYVARARAEGAGGYIAKTASAEAMRDCLRRVLDGAGAFQLATSATATSATSAMPPLSAAGLATLSATERRVLLLVGRGLTSRELAGTLGVSVRTVENHRANICRKLGLRGPHRLTAFALAAAPLLGDEEQPTNRSKSTSS